MNAYDHAVDASGIASDLEDAAIEGDAVTMRERVATLRETLDKIEACLGYEQRAATS